MSLALVLGCQGDGEDTGSATGSTVSATGTTGGDGDGDTTGGDGDGDGDSGDGDGDSGDGDGDSGDGDGDGDGDTGDGDGDTGDGDGDGDCGNGQVDPGEACDDGNADDTDSCTTLCMAPACDDGIVSGDESDVDCGGGCGACGLDGACVDGGDCESGYCSEGSTCATATSCLDIMGSNPDAGTGVYSIDVDGDGAEPMFDAHCDMDIDGGGWTLTLNLDTSDGHVMWWANPKWTDDQTLGTADVALSEDHKSPAWMSMAGATQILVVVHQEGAVDGWKSFTKIDGSTMHAHLQGGDNTEIGTADQSDIDGLWADEQLVRASTKLYANHCVQQGGSCTTGNTGSPDGHRIGSDEAAPTNNVGGGLGNWSDMNYCCNGAYGSGKVCNGSAFRTNSEAQSGWAPCYNGGTGHFGTDSYTNSAGSCNNTNCAQANWSAPNGQELDYAIFLR